MRRHYEYEGEPVYTTRRGHYLANRREGNRGYRTLSHNRRLREIVIFTSKKGWLGEEQFFREYEQCAEVGKIPPPVRGVVGRVYRSNIGFAIVYRGTSFQTGFLQITLMERKRVAFYPTKGWLSDYEGYKFLKELYETDSARHRRLLQRMQKVAKWLRSR